MCNSIAKCSTNKPAANRPNKLNKSNGPGDNIRVLNQASSCDSMNAGLRSFRITTALSEQGKVMDLLQAEGFEFEPEPFSPFAFRLSLEPFPLGRSLAAFFGLIYIQDRSSMLPPLVLAPPLGARVLDCCASPGSKTGFLAQLVGKNGFVLGNEPNPTRLGTLRANLFTLNFLNAATCRFSAAELPLPENSFSHILLDPPCSGWGTAERHPKVLTLWTEDKAKTLVALQRQLLKQAARLLAPGGELVFSTCTTNRAENEEQVVWVKENLGLTQLNISAPAGFTPAPLEMPEADGALRIAPDLGEGQGFFVAKFGKTPESSLQALGALGAEDAALFQALPQNSTPAPTTAADDIFTQTLPPVSANGQKTKKAFGQFRNKKTPAVTPQMLAAAALDSDCIDSNFLPPGQLMALANNVMFMPEPGMQFLPENFPWQGCFVGKLAGNGLLPLPRLRTLMREANDAPAVNVDDCELIKQLLSGRSLNVNMPGKSWAGLYFKNLPLGLLRIKGGRAIWTER